MKKLFIILCLLSGVQAQGQWAVYDAAAHSQSIINQSQNVAKYLEMIHHQVEQVQQLTEQVNQLKNFNDAFGVPAKIREIVGAGGLLQELRTTGLGKTLGELQQLAQGADALKYHAGGLYQAPGTSFRTPGGEQIPRRLQSYRPSAALIKTTTNFTNVYTSVVSRRNKLKAEIAATTEQLRASNTDAETKKLTGVLLGLHAALASANEEVEQALSLVMVQDAQNRDDRQRQDQARSEEQQAEFAEGIRNYTATFKLSSEPAHFPE